MKTNMPFKKRCNCNEDMLLIVDINNLDMKEKKKTRTFGF